MKILLPLFIMVFIFCPCIFSQSSKIDSLQTLLKKDREDTIKVNHLNELARELIFNDPDTAIGLSTQALQLAEESKWKKGIANSFYLIGVCKYLSGDYKIAFENGTKALSLYEELRDRKGKVKVISLIGLIYSNQGDYPKALDYLLQALKMDEELGDKNGIGKDLGNIGIVYVDQGDYPKAHDYYFKALKMAEEVGDNNGIANHLGNIGLVYNNQADYPKALNYYFKALKLNEELGNKIGISTNLGNIGLVYYNQNDYSISLEYYFKALKMDEELGNKTGTSRHLGNIGELYYSQGDYPKALDYYFKALKIAEELGDKYGSAFWHGSIGKLHSKTGKFKEAEVELKSAIALQESLGSKDHLRQFEENLSQLYDTTGRHDLALFHYKKAMMLKDTLFNEEKNKEITRKEMNYEFDKKEALAKVEQAKKDAEAKKTRNLQYTAIGVFLMLAIFLFWNNRLKQKAKIKIEKAYEYLKITQQQLIQSEKMASLGELTAGIAHEIQNPLNFVNNFSEVNKELIEELKGEKLKVNRDQKLEDELLNDLSQNLEKINHHGKRADAIVKGMLQHSRTSSGQKELTDINALCDEYLRLSYHGLRAKDKSFNAKFDTDFDSSLPKLNVVPQDIGRVVLNLINNAFFAVNERLRQAQPDSGYEPTVTVTTKKISDKIEIRVKDNGNGIPDTIKEKIFQPFFTTKPTGQGTGLGLSLSYDIVKAHGGELRVETKEARPDDPVGRGEGSEFIILLPLL